MFFGLVLASFAGASIPLSSIVLGILADIFTEISIGRIGL